MALMNLKCIVCAVHVSHDTAFAELPTYHVAHRLELDAASHAARCTRLLHLGFIGLIKLPDGIAGMAEDPEVVSADIAELLQVGLVNSRAVKLLNECVWLDGRAGILAGGWRRGE